MDTIHGASLVVLNITSNIKEQGIEIQKIQKLHVGAT